MRVLATAFAVTAALLPVATGEAHAGEGARQEMELSLTTTQPGAPTGNRFEARWRNPEDPDSKPYAMKRMVAHLPEGFTYDTGALEQCHASDHELMLTGAAACPAGSLLSRGTLVTDNGESVLFPRHMTLSLTMFNSDDEFLTLAEVVDPPLQPALRAVSHNRIQGTTVTTEFPRFPTGAEPDGYMAFQRMQVAWEPAVRDGRAYSRTAPSCPAAGHWTIRVDFVYQDGVEQTLESRPACTQGPPVVEVRGVPRGRCASRPFTARVSIDGGDRLDRALLLLDRRRIRSTTRRRFSARIDPRRLTRGAHRLTVVARTRGGPDIRRTARFRACA